MLYTNTDKSPKYMLIIISMSSLFFERIFRNSSHSLDTDTVRCTNGKIKRSVRTAGPMCVKDTIAVKRHYLRKLKIHRQSSPRLNARGRDR